AVVHCPTRCAHRMPWPLLPRVPERRGRRHSGHAPSRWPRHTQTTDRRLKRISSSARHALPPDSTMSVQSRCRLVCRAPYTRLRLRIRLPDSRLAHKRKVVSVALCVRSPAFRRERIDHRPISELTGDTHHSTTFGTRKKLSSVNGAFLTMISAMPPSVTASARFFIAIGITEVIGSTPSTFTSESCSTKANMAFSSPLRCSISSSATAMRARCAMRRTVVASTAIGCPESDDPGQPIAEGLSPRQRDFRSVQGHPPQECLPAGPQGLPPLQPRSQRPRRWLPLSAPARWEVQEVVDGTTSHVPAIAHRSGLTLSWFPMNSLRLNRDSDEGWQCEHMIDIHILRSLPARF